ncbi:hypothetical protein BDR26DRAFT_861436, partial [Obelidium mucronatum]
MSLKLWCVLGKDNTLTPFEVAIDPTASVSSLKDAIRAKMAPDLDYLPASRLTLVRVCKEGVHGVTEDELERFNEVLQLETYSKSPERAIDTVSTFRDTRGACLVKDGFLFKVMNSMTKVSYFAESLPNDLCHVLVLIPAPPTSESASSCTTGKEPEKAKRKQRWIELNGIINRNTKKSKTIDATGYLYPTWNEIKSIFNLANYIQPRRNIDDVHLSFLAQYLSMATTCNISGNTKPLHFIAPMLISVCALFKGDVEIVVEEDLVGKLVKAHGHFEFMIRRGRTAVCIVEAKKDDFEQGMVQYLIGCEVAAEVGGLDIVYGIVTNYVQWNFLRSLNDKVEMNECSFRLTPNGPEKESLKEIVEKIYAMLSSEQGSAE